MEMRDLNRFLGQSLQTTDIPVWGPQLQGHNNLDGIRYIGILRNQEPSYETQRINKTGTYFKFRISQNDRK
jgi:hypothetical protein